MEKLRYSILSLLMAILAIGASAQSNARLRIPDMTLQNDKWVDIPIELLNSTPVVGIQFEIQYPEKAETYYNPSLAAERKVNHEWVKTYKADRPANCQGYMIYSADNTPIAGNSGAVLYIPMKFNGEYFGEGSNLEFSLTDVVITTARGENIAVGSEIGKIVIAKGPDLQVKDVEAEDLIPGKQVSVKWKVDNIGTLSTGGGWREHISLESVDGTFSRGLTTVHYDNVLDVNGTLQRTATFEVPEVLGIDGTAQIKVELSPNSDTFESPTARGNNSSTCEVNVAKRLYLETSPQTAETYSSPVRARVTRSGYTTEAMTVAITKKVGDGRLSLPTEVVIPAGWASEYFYYNVVDDDELNDSDLFTIAASGGGYDKATVDIKILDNELPDLLATLSKEEVTEGETLTLIIQAERAPQTDLIINLYCDMPRRLSMPSSVTLPKDKTEVAVEITAVDNEDVDDESYPEIRVSASGYNPAAAVFELKDDDMPSISMTVTPTTVKESAGPYAMTAKIKRHDKTDRRVTIKFSDTSKNRLVYLKSIVLEKGVEDAEFNIGVVDNTLVDGDEEITFTAAVYMSSCSCTAGSHTGGSVDAVLKVLDNDGPSLTIVTDNATWLEGTEHTITVSRNTTPTQALTVQLASDKDAMLEYDKTVIIPAGQTEVKVEVKVLSNDISGDGGTATFTAQTPGYSMGACFVLISDQTLPDATISSITVSPEEVEVGNKATVKISLKNEGASAIPSRSKVNVYANGTLWFTFWTEEDVAPGKVAVLSKEASVPETPIAYKLSAAVNEEKAFEELSYNNNRRDEGVLTVTAGFQAKVSVDKTVIRPGETVTISGHATGSKAKDADIEVYLIGQTRITLEAKADANGDFSVQWTPFELQSGHFAVGACSPGEYLSAEMASIDVYGIAVKTDHTGIEPSETDEVKGTFTVVNTGSLPLSNIAVTVASKPDNCSVTLDRTTIPTLAVGEEVTVGYTLVGHGRTEGKDWAKINFSATASQKVTSTDYLNFYCHPLFAVLETDTNLIEATATRGQARDYTVRLTNAGRGETGKITLTISVPWIKAVTPTTMPSLAPGQSADIVLSFRTEGLQLNVEQSATIGINCEKGDGIPLRIKMTPVSESVGTLTIDACDQYTYRTEEAPHLAGATVTIKNPNTYTVVAEGKTGSDGHYRVELSEGYYDVTVSAPDHATYNNTLMVNPGRDTFRTVNLNFTGGITVNYNVEPVEGGIEDEYEVVTTVVYETNVPAPVVVLDGPDSVDLDAMAVGESKLLYYYATNKGLITALDYEFFIPEDTEEYTFKCLAGTGPFDLAANQMVAFPVMFTKIASFDDNEPQNVRRRVNGAEAMKKCMESFAQRYYDLCGGSMSENKGARNLTLRACALTGIFSAIGGGSSGTGGPSSGGGYGNAGSGGGTVMVGGSRNICDPATAKAADDAISALAAIGAGTYGMAGAAAAKGIDYGIIGVDDGFPGILKQGGKDLFDGLVGIGLGNRYGDAANTAYSNINNYKAMAGLKGSANEPVVSSNPKSPYNPGVARSIGVAPNPNAIQKAPEANEVYPVWFKEFVFYSYPFFQQLELLDLYQQALYGEDCWMECDPDTRVFVDAIFDLPDDVRDYNAVRDFKPTSVTHEQAQRLFERIINTGQEPGWEENYPDFAYIQKICQELKRRNDYAQTQGFEDCAQMCEHYVNLLYENIEKAEASICAHITLQFTQQMVMTREAFRGTLTVYNGHDNQPMQDAVLNLTVIDPEGFPVTKQKMDVSLESVNKFSAKETIADGIEWRLGDVDAKETATATVLYIPTKYAAPEKPLEYSFEGSLTYTDPFTGMTVTEEFMPSKLTVNPSPNLDMTYFMQRDIFGDDPLTPEVEPIVPAEFSVLINNVGNGDAMNVKMVTNAPEIVENEKGLLIDFDLYSSALNGNEATMAIGGKAVTNFGSIPAGKTAFAQWWFTSTLLGHFVDYNVKATHVTSHDNPDLSLLNEVTIHELIRSVKYGPDAFDVAFLCDDNFDHLDTPDHLYLSNGVVETVSNPEGVMLYVNETKQNKIHIKYPSDGWNYASMASPVAGDSEIISVTRQSDGKKIDLRNVWLTSCTLRDGHEPLYENKIHILDFIQNSVQEYYIVEFADNPSDVLQVTAINGVPEGDKVYEGQVTEVSVTFSAPVDESTFTTEDITLYCQGKRVDTSDIRITKVYDNVFKLDLSKVTAASGYYVLSVQTAEIYDTEGKPGKVGKQAAWSQVLGEYIEITFVSTPEGAGKVDALSGVYEYGTLLTLKAEPSEGYHFDHWTDGSTENPYLYEVTQSTTLGAVFAPNIYTIEYYVDGVLYQSQEKEFGAPITPIDEPKKEGWKFSGWSAMPENMPASNVRVEGSFIRTGIEAILTDGETADVYSIGGILLMRNATITDIRDRLPVGYYIIGGYKFYNSPRH